MIGITASRLETLGWRLLPLVLIAAGLLADLAPLPGIGPAGLGPALGFCIFFHFAVLRPAMLPAPALFGLGLAFDLLAGQPLGLTPLVLLTVRWALAGHAARLAAAGPLAIWAAFLVAAALAEALRWLTFALLLGAPPPLAAPLAQASLSLAAYPVVAWLLGRLDPWLAEGAHAPGG
jgi:rod shape-determining protein MreD